MAQTKGQRQHERALLKSRLPKKEKPRAQRLCTGGKAHRDAERIAEFAILKGQFRGDDNAEIVVYLTNEEFAKAVGFVEHLGGDYRRTDISRYQRARNHMRDYIDETGQPCTGLTTHYRQVQPGTGLWFIDGTRKREKAWKAAIGIMRGWAHVEKSQRTERRRMRETLQEFLDSIDANKYGDAYRLVTRVLISIENDGVVPDGLMAEFESWLLTLEAV